MHESDDVSQASPFVVLMTAPGLEEAQGLARELVGRRLAACANLLPGVRSVYWWEGALEEAQEVMLVLKTTSERVEDLVRVAEQVHSYDVPEVLALPITGGSGPYLQWLTAEVHEGGEGGARD